ncbi:alpha/beta hydrolase [Haloferula sp.]|uniref:alpha/beta hydrolase n=1 Tax=Haloferula sp. TaxID=2497595 RepID=UPI003C70CC66
MKKTTRSALIIVRRILGYGLLVTFVSLISIAVYVLQSRPNLSLWQEVDLDEEFEENSGVTDFAGYLELEDRLFDQLEREVYQKTPPGDAHSVNRYQKGSLTDPTSMPTNWNRTFQLEQKDPKAGVLLLHGLTDSPYSMRSLAEEFHNAGASVIGLRIPGHGTAPSGLVEMTWQDMAAAVRLAAVHLKKSIGDKPFYVVGYSNGGALTVVYTLESLEDESLPRPDGLVLLSPEIGITKVAALAVWQGRLGHWLGLEKLAWTSILYEYNPYKYNSFAVNAGNLAYRITLEIDRRLERMSKAGELDDFPRMLAFQSVVDATVSAPAVVSRLFDRLPENDHELVLFDINHREIIDHLLAKDPSEDLGKILSDSNRKFTLSIVSNSGEEGEATEAVTIRRRAAGQSTVSIENTDMTWPKEIYSLAHIALPFPGDDPFYGSGDGGKIPTLGNRALRGERGTLLITPADMLRQKWNPFHPWLVKRALELTKLSAPAPAGLSN